MQSTPTNLQVLLHEIDRRLPPEHSSTVRLVLASMAGQLMRITRKDTLIPFMERDAEKLINQGLTRHMAVVRIMRTHGVTKRRAYKLVDRAIERSQEVTKDAAK